MLLKFSPHNLWVFQDVPVKCPQQFLYNIEFIYRRGCEKRIKSEFCGSFFPGIQNLDVFFGEIFVELGWKSFSVRNNSLEPHVF